MRSLTVALAAVLMMVSYAQAGVQIPKGQNNQNQNGEQPGPFGFPGQKTMGEKLMLSSEQEAALIQIYGTYRKLEQKIKQAASNKNSNSAPSDLPDAGTAKGKMIMEIRAILKPGDQTTKFQDIVDSMGKKKKN